MDGVVASFFEITEQREQQWALRLASQQLSRRLLELEAFYEHAPIGAAMHGPDMRYLRANKVFTEILGRPASEIIGQHPKDIVPDVWGQVEHIFRTVAATKEPVFNFQVRAKIDATNDEIRTWTANYFPIVIEGSDVIEIAFTVMDITQLKRLENSLSAKQDELKDVGDRILRNFEHAPFSIVIHHGPDHIIVHANKRAREILGDDDPTGKSEGDIIPDIYNDLRKVYDAVYHSSEMYIDDEVVINAKNSANKDIKGVFRRIVQPYKDADGSVTGVVSINMDISELVEMRDAFAIQKDRMSSIVDEVDTHIILIDVNGKILDVNTGALSMSGSSREGLTGRSIDYFASKCMHLDAQERFRGAVKKAFSGEASRYQERIVSFSGGRTRRVILSVSPVQNKASCNGTPVDHRIRSVAEILITISDQTALLEATDHKGMLVAELEHRVKNIITTIQAVTQFTASTASDPQTMVMELDERLAAMARTHDKLTASGWEKQTFRDILNLEISAYASTQAARVFCTGDDLSLPPKTAMLVGLAVHELLKNAVKYGALSNSTGVVEISVQTKDNALECLTWTERDGPEVKEASRTGFGTLLLKSILPDELGVKGHLELVTEGLIYRLFR